MPLVLLVEPAAAGETLLAAPAEARAEGATLLVVPALEAGPLPKVTAPTASWTLSGGGGTTALALVEPEVDVEVEVDPVALTLEAGETLLVPDVPVELPLVPEVEVLPEAPLVAPVDVLVQAGLAAEAPVVAAEDADVTGRADAAAEGEAPTALLGDAALLARAEEAMLDGGLAAVLAPGLVPAALLPQAASTSEAAARTGMRALNMTWTPTLRPPFWRTRMNF